MNNLYFIQRGITVRCTATTFNISLRGKPVSVNYNNSTSLESIQLSFNYCERLLLTHLHHRVYNIAIDIDLSELGHRGENEHAQALKQ